MPSALILIADGTEEMEFTIAFDTLIRAGVSVTSAFVSPESKGDAEASVAICSRGLKIVPDIGLSPSGFGPDKYDAIVIPGGAKGAETMSNNTIVQNLVKEYFEKEKTIGMICAGSLAAKSSGLPKQPLTSHPSVKEELEKDFEYKEESVVISKNLITSRGPGTAFPFALALVEVLCGKEKRGEVYKPMVFEPGTPF